MRRKNYITFQILKMKRKIQIINLGLHSYIIIVYRKIPWVLHLHCTIKKNVVFSREIIFFCRAAIIYLYIRATPISLWYRNKPSLFPSSIGWKQTDEGGTYFVFRIEQLVGGCFDFAAPVDTSNFLFSLIWF